MYINLWHFGSMAFEIYKSKENKENKKRPSGNVEFYIVWTFRWCTIHCCDPINSIKYVVFIDYKHLLCVLLKNTNDFTSSPSTYLDVSSVSESVHQIDPVYECQCLQMSQPNVVSRCTYVRACVRVYLCVNGNSCGKWVRRYRIRYRAGASASTEKEKNNRTPQWKE